MTVEKFIEKLDWSSAVAAATLVIEKEKKNGNEKDVSDAYLYRGKARCFINPDKEGKHKEAIDDLSRAIIIYKKICEEKIKNDKKEIENDEKEIENNIYEAYYYRAYAYYLDGDYEKAIADCCHINDILQKDELLGKIYLAMNNYHESVKRFKRAMRNNKSNQNPQIPNPGLLQSYQEACKRMNNV